MLAYLTQGQQITCANLRCQVGTTCVMNAATKQPECASVTSTPAQCGGIAGLQCTAGYECVKTCGPNVSDCMGTCEMITKTAAPGTIPPVVTCSMMRCGAGYVCEDSAKGGECVPSAAPATRPSTPDTKPPVVTCAVMRCGAGYVCEDSTKGGECVPSAVPATRPSTPDTKPPVVTCAVMRCGAGYVCEDSAKGGECVPSAAPATRPSTPDTKPPTAMQCGGIAGFRCPAAYECVKTCGPNVSDCMGTCEMIVPKTTTPDTKPPTTPKCGGIAGLRCPTGYDCVMPPCAAGTTDCMGECMEQKPQECGGKAGLQCPDGHSCFLGTQCAGIVDCMGICKKDVPDTKPPVVTCSMMRCGAGYVCEDSAKGGECVPSAAPSTRPSTPDTKPPTAMQCGGIAGFRCPAAYECVKTCGPNVSDCMGTCEMITKTAAPGTKPPVVTCSMMRCGAGYVCEDSAKGGECVPSAAPSTRPSTPDTKPPTAMQCGGIAGFRCPAAYECVKTCGPNVSDCMGTCEMITKTAAPGTKPPVVTCSMMRCGAGYVCEDSAKGGECVPSAAPATRPSTPDTKPPTAMQCGGIAGFRCPAAYECVKTCGPNVSDCMGTCEMITKTAAPGTKPPVVTCSMMRCGAGYVCEDSAKGGECVPSAAPSTRPSTPDTKPPTAMQCGGIAGFRCPAAYECVKTCGPNVSDCMGTCEMITKTAAPGTKPPVVTCSMMRCGAGYVCEDSAKGGECVPSAAPSTRPSTPDTKPPTAMQCGGIAGFRCPAAYECVKTCGPNVSDCMGTCEMITKTAAPGTKPPVVTCSMMRCGAGYVCEDSAKGGECVPSAAPSTRPSTPDTKPPTAMQCGGIAGFRCPAAYECVKTCGPNVSDCMGTCEMIVPKTTTPDTKPPTTPKCGGIAGLRCPTGYDCMMPPCAAGTTDCIGECMEQKPQECGGKAGLQCPDGHSCFLGTQCAGIVDCMGICKKDVPDTKPPVVTCSMMRCGAGYVCEDSAKGGECVPSAAPATRPSTPDTKPPTAMQCGGIAGFRCPAAYECVKTCGPNVSDCMGTCEMITKTAAPGTKSPAECKDGEKKQKDCNTCTCRKGMFVCTEKACEQRCGGIGGLRCPVGFKCEGSCPPGMTDCMGTCKEDRPVSGKVCKSSDDCAKSEFCRQVQDAKSSGCGKEMVCTPRAKKGDMCGGYTTPCYHSVCLSSLKCVTSQMIMDAPGTCVEPILAVGEVCRVEDVTTWMAVDRSVDCPKGTKCTMQGDSKEWKCVVSSVARCVPTSCGDEEKCVIEKGSVRCIAPTVDDKCNLKMDRSILCAAGGLCQKGYACTGCQQTCKCDVRGNKVCTKECRPTCEKVDDKTDCMTEPVSEWDTLGCRTYSCFGFTRSASIEEMKYCCEKTGRYCKKDEDDKFDCKSDPKGWSFAQRKWCCEERQVGCPVAKFDCSVPDDSVQIMKGADGFLQTSVVDVSMWDEKRAAYCCEKFQVGCPADKDQFDCDWSTTTFAPWSDAQSEWCCAVKGIRCPEKEVEGGKTEEEKKCQAKRDERQAWGEDTRKYCCLNEGAGCATEKYDCYGDSRKMSKWSAHQKDWCCDEENIACKVDCRADANVLAESEKKDCCSSKGLHCGKDEIVDVDPVDEKKHRRSIRLSFKGSIAKILENPKRFLRKFRKTILRVSKGLKPSNLLIKYVGGLMKDNAVPPQDARERWGTTIPSSWNTKLFADEDATAFNRGVATLGHGVSSTREQQTMGDQGSFIDLDIQDDDAALVDSLTDVLRSSIEESRVGGGPLRDNGDGSTVIVEPIGKGMEELPSPSNDDKKDDNSSIIYGIVGAVAALCIGGALVAFTVYKKNQNKTSIEGGEFLSAMEEVQSTPAPKEVQVTRI